MVTLLASSVQSQRQGKRENKREKNRKNSEYAAHFLQVSLPSLHCKSCETY